MIIKLKNQQHMRDTLGKVRIDKHTVSLKDEGDWWGYFHEGELVSVLCIRKYHNGNMYFSENFTKQEHRGNGYFTSLLRHVLHNHEGTFEAHALISSKRIYEYFGFECKRIREYKHGTQYVMIKE